MVHENQEQHRLDDRDGTKTHARIVASALRAAPQVPHAESIGGAAQQPAHKLTGYGPLSPGQQFGPRYRILRLLGMGGMGAVYEVHDDELNESVALKVIKL